MSRPAFWRVPRNHEPYDEPVTVGSPAEGELRRGDVVVKINGRPTSHMTHEQAVEMIKKAGPSITLVVKRVGGAPTISSPDQQLADAGCVSHSGFPFTISTNTTNLTPRTLSRQVTTVSGDPASSRSITEIMHHPVENLPVTVFPGQQLQQQQQQRYINKDLFPFLIEEMDRDRERIVVTHQPYRTTPLVLPGAKTTRDTASTTQSYLALQQQNPMLWNGTAVVQPAPQQKSPEAVLKQKLEAAAALVQRNVAHSQQQEGHVAITHEPDDAPPPKQEIVHKQFNSPLGLYSSENVQEAMALQSGMIPPPAQQPRLLDLKYSETLRALQEENSQKPQQQQQQQEDARGLKQVRPPSAAGKTVACNPHFKVNVMGMEKEKIAQSHSFKRLMADVLGETDF